MSFYSKVKKLCKSSVIVLVVIFGIIGVTFTIFGVRGVQYQLGGAVNFNEAELQDLEPGTYVEGEFKLCYGMIGEYSSTKNGVTSIESYLCVFGVADENYKNIIYVPVKIKAADSSKARKLMNQTIEAEGFFGSINEDKLTESFEFEGVLKENTSKYDEIGLYEQEAKRAGITSDEMVDYFLDINDSKIILLLFFGLGVVFLAIAVIPVVLYTTGAVTKKLKAYVAANNLSGREDFLLNDFENGIKASKNVRMGREYAYYGKGVGVHMLAYSDIVWAYVDTVKVKNSVTFQLVLVSRTRQRDMISFNQKQNSDAACAAIIAANPGIIVGNTPELQELYRKNFAEIVKMSDEKKMSAVEMLDGDNYTQE